MWQRLAGLWRGSSSSGGSPDSTASGPDLGPVMRFFTTQSKVAAQQQLGLTRLDYVMSAWLRVREATKADTECLLAGGGSAAACVARRLQLLVSKCLLNDV